MGKFLIGWVCILIANSFTLATAQDKIEQNLIPISSVVGKPHRIVLNSYLNKEWVIGLDDNSYWKLLSLESRKQTWKEWWYGITPAEWGLDDCFFFNSRSWSNLAEIQIYEAVDHVFLRYKYILENTQTGQMAFANFIPCGQKLLPKTKFAEKFFSHPWGKAVKIVSNKHKIQGLFLLDDNTIWQVLPAEMASKSWGEWLLNLKVEQPDAPFICSFNDWKAGDCLQIYFYEEQGQLSSIYKSEEKAMRVYLIENRSQSQFVYAKPVSVFECLNICHAHAMNKWLEGYREGYAQAQADNDDDDDDDDD